jgi:voltage-dependent anion channel protein 2
MVCKFSDISKAPTDLLNDDYTSKVGLKVKKNAGPVAFSLDTTRAAAGTLSSKVSTKFAYAGLAVDKAQVDASGAQTLETKLPLAAVPGLTLSFKASKGADLGATYKSGAFVGTAKLDVKDLAKVSTSGCVGLAHGITVGGDAGYSLKSSSFSGFNVGASYASGPLLTSLTTSDKLSSVNVSMMYKVKPDITLASSTSHSASKNFDLVAVGGQYKASFGDLKAKFGSDGVVSACLVKEIAPKVKLTASGSIVGADTSTFKYGLGLSM